MSFHVVNPLRNTGVHYLPYTNTRHFHIHDVVDVPTLKTFHSVREVSLLHDDSVLNPFPALMTSCDVRGEGFLVCQKDVTGRPARFLTGHACSGEVQF